MLQENLIRLRKERGLTQEALAAKLHVVRQTVSKWEKAAAVPDADTLCRIADALEVPVSALLGESEQQLPPDTASIAQSLAQINEQLAVRNHRAANVWKTLCLVLLLLIGILLGKLGFARKSNDSAAGSVFPEKIEVTGVCFTHTDRKLFFSCVPSAGSEDIDYSLSMFSIESSIPSVTVAAKYENGVCTAVFNERSLSEYAGYTVILHMEDGTEERNHTVAVHFRLREDGCEWETPEI